MRILLQKVSQASVTIGGKVKSEIGKGLLILLGIEEADDQQDIEWLCRKVVNIRIFNDEADKMNLSVKDVAGEVIVVSQFTLHANVKKGNRPSFIRAAKPDIAIPLYEQFIEHLQTYFETEVQTGEFGAMMEVGLVNDGPVTIWLDSKNKE
ncbi:MAG: D-aminoacyl-tRNA deacylase [Chitinophagales bacterium]